MQRRSARRRLAGIAAHVVAQQRREQRVHGDDCLPAAGAAPAAREHHNGLGVELPGGRPQGPARTPTEAAAHNLSLADHEKTPLMHAPFDWAVDGAPRKEGLRVVTPEMAAQFDRDGFCVYEDAFAPDELAALVEEIDRLEAELSNDGGISSKEEITFCAHLVLKSEMCRAFTGQRLFSDLCHDLLAADTARLYWDQSVYKKPAPEKIFPFHQDNGYTFIEPQPYLTCWVALTDATRENGCPNVIPGVHRLGARLHDYDDHHNGWTVKGLATENAVSVPVRGGSIVCFSSLTPHMTGPNVTDGVRKAYICQYAPDGVVSVGNERDERNAAADPDRQYYVLENGRPVPPPPMPPVA